MDPKEMNRETPEETGVYLLSDSLPQHSLYTRISGLQKLKVPPRAREGSGWRGSTVYSLVTVNS